MSIQVSCSIRALRNVYAQGALGPEQRCLERPRAWKVSAGRVTTRVSVRGSRGRASQAGQQRCTGKEVSLCVGVSRTARTAVGGRGLGQESMGKRQRRGACRARLCRAHLGVNIRCRTAAYRISFWVYLEAKGTETSLDSCLSFEF